MQDTDLFMELAGIAGVFVGFGALIAVRSGGPTDAQEVTPMRSMVWMGIMAVIAALAPVTLGRYGLTDHEVLALSSVLVLVAWGVMFVSMARTPEYKAAWTAELEADRMARSRWLVVVGSAAYVLLMLVVVLAPIIIMLGLVPDLEAALYFTVAVLILLGAGWSLLGLVLSQRRPAAA
jgi:hypothetical protein